VDELITAIDAEMVTYARDALIEETWQIVLGDIVLLPLHHQVIVWAMRNDLQLPINPAAVPWFRIARFGEPG
jgi:peptide/nickel transport system substrate-binding protein